MENYHKLLNPHRLCLPPNYFFLVSVEKTLDKRFGSI
jgi:hypothetical protein